MKKITESTLIPLSLVISVIGLAFWAGVLDSRVSVAQAAVEKIEEKHDEAMAELRRVNETLGRIQGFLEKRFGTGE
jgi:UDP-N-acetyl-D-mannosaminuronate dehydrogenase